VNQPPPASGERPAHVFTPENIRAAVEQSLHRMRTDHLDLVQFHISPSRETLERTVPSARSSSSVTRARRSSGCRARPNLVDHIEMGCSTLQILSALREHGRDPRDAGAGRARSSVAAWHVVPRPSTTRRWRATRVLAADGRGVVTAGRRPISTTSRRHGAMEFMLRFTLSHPDMHTTIVSTANSRTSPTTWPSPRRAPSHPTSTGRKQRLAAAQ
jgi:hypothetical protein